jgi:hypothetical protein
MDKRFMIRPLPHEGESLSSFLAKMSGQNRVDFWSVVREVRRVNCKEKYQANPDRLSTI